MKRFLWLYALLLGGLATFGTDGRADIENTATAFGIYGGEEVESGQSAVGVEVDLREPSIQLYKTIAGIEDTNGNGTTDVGDTITYLFSLKNSGGVTLNDIMVQDEKIGFVSGLAGPLAPGDTDDSLRANYVITQDDMNGAGVENSAIATAQPVALKDGTIRDRVTDVSDAGDDTVETAALDGSTDIDPTNDPTVLTLAQVASLTIVKELVDQEILFPAIQKITFAIEVKNTGNIRQTGIQVRDNLANFVGSAALASADYPIELTLSGFDGGTANPAYDGMTDTDLLSATAALDPGESGRVQLAFVVSTVGGSFGTVNTAETLSNEIATPLSDDAEVANVDADNDGVPDGLETKSGDRDGDGIPDSEDFDPTGYFYCEEDGRILSGGQITVSGGGFSQTGVGVSGPIVVLRDGSAGYYQFHVTATGTYSLGISYPPFGVASTARTSLGTIDATTLLPSNPAVLGAGEVGATGLLSDISAAANPFYTGFDIEAGDPFILNNNIPLRNCQNNLDVAASKAADRATAILGETVNYTVTYTNNSAFTYTGAQLIDILPGGLRYTPGTGRLNGVAQDPSVTGNRHSWTTNLAPGATLNLTYSARVVSPTGFGARINTAWIENSFGRQLSNSATATIKIIPEAVFDCSDVIGKVFDDKNANGYQDGPNTLPRPITNQEYEVGKYGVSDMSEAQDDTEPGLPGVRLVTPDGLLITTDEFGRFSVPCAALPRDIGSNFMLKLDTRTLPTGYRVTTENPRVIRLTAGKMAKLNFGAALSNVVTIDLAAAAFVPGKSTPRAALADAVDGLLAQIRTKPSTLRLTYVLTKAEDKALARERLRAMEQMIRKRWRGRGTYKLTIEKTVTRSR